MGTNFTTKIEAIWCVDSETGERRLLTMEGEDITPESNSKVIKRGWWKKIAKKLGLCCRCQPHKVENESRKPRPDKHKNKRR